MPDGDDLSGKLVGKLLACRKSVLDSLRAIVDAERSLVQQIATSRRRDRECMMCESQRRVFSSSYSA